MPSRQEVFILEESMRSIYLDFYPEELYQMIHELVRIAYPDSYIMRSDDQEFDMHIQLHAAQEENGVKLTGMIARGDKKTSRQELAVIEGEPWKSELRKAARSFVYRLLCEHEGRNINPYGVLTGVRPLKPVHRLLDEGYEGKNLVEQLEKEYLIEHSKAELLAGIGSFNHSYLPSKEEARRKVSVYVGIPFCPSKCYYCSFPGAVLRNYEKDIPPFMDALCREINAIGDCIHELGLTVQSVYIGGGTPTVLQENEIKSLFAALDHNLLDEDTGEITVEAGRPDTLHRHTFGLLKELGVDRICINPQTMNDATLERIGRNHNSQAIHEAMQMARDSGISAINMDLILGLPGEGMADFLHTLKEVQGLRPENITVHSLAVKRGSRLAEEEGTSGVFDQINDVRKAVEEFRTLLGQQGYQPYYLYRQKYMKANVENTGYALPAYVSVYNVQVMEERQTILGLGGGASSKFIHPADWSLTAFHNPKDPFSYCQSIDRLIQAKVDKLRALN